jgi:hypothetical protein
MMKPDVFLDGRKLAHHSLVIINDAVSSLPPVDNCRVYGFTIDISGNKLGLDFDEAVKTFHISQLSCFRVFFSI